MLPNRLVSNHRPETPLLASDVGSERLPVQDQPPLPSAVAATSWACGPNRVEKLSCVTCTQMVRDSAEET